MATNPYFSSQFSLDSGLDGDLYRDLIEESIQIKGRDLFYLPRTLENFDSYFGEDVMPSSFNGIATIEMYLENVESWQGEGNILAKFGLEIRDQATLIVAKRRFMQEVSASFPEITRPREGDIIVLPQEYDNRVRAFEITFVNNESVFYQLGDLPTYKLTVKNFEYSGETFNTGNTSIDDYQQDWGLTIDITVENGSGTYTPGETVNTVADSLTTEISEPIVTEVDEDVIVVEDVFANLSLVTTESLEVVTTEEDDFIIEEDEIEIPGSGWSAEVVEFNYPILVLTNIVGDLPPGGTIVGSASGASYDFVSVEESVGNDSSMNDNTNIRVADVIDFSENNPFSGL